MQYRPQIDGLRAVAILPVILFHAGFEAVRGGFYGVDVFFVISGYLITTILLKDARQGRFSILTFYERRARRILPALFFVLIACLPLAYLTMTPVQLTDFANSLVAVLAFVSNFFFRNSVDYFAPSADLQPLLHTWSLAIEEQYYLLFPTLLLALRRASPRRMLAVLIALTLASLAIWIVGAETDPQKTFFFTPGRFWEISTGSVCAVLAAQGRIRPSNGLAALGLGLVLYAILWGPPVGWQAMHTALPVAGSALILLFAQEKTWVARVLSLRILVGIGLISYSAYLWHQPLFAFARLRSLTAPSATVMAALAALSLVLAAATWAWVERAFRGKAAAPLLPDRNRLFATCGALALALSALAATVHVTQGLRFRFTPDVLAILDVGTIAPDRTCHLSEGRAFNGHPVSGCLYPDQTKAPEVMVIGDSHAHALSDALGRLLAARGLSSYRVSYSTCPAIPGLKRLDVGSKFQCDRFTSEAYRFAKARGIKTVVLAGRYGLYLHDAPFDNGEGGAEERINPVFDLADPVPANAPATRQARILQAYERAIRDLAQDFNVVLVGPVPEAGWNVPLQLFKDRYFNGGGVNLSNSYPVFRARNREILSLFDRLAAELPSVRVARVHEALCDKASERCLNADGGGMYYRDDDHPSPAGAARLAPVILQAIEALRSKNAAP